MNKHFTASSLANFLSATMYGNDSNILQLASIATAGEGSLTFVTDLSKYDSQTKKALSVGAIILAPELPSDFEQYNAGTVIIIDNPRAAFGKIAAEFFEKKPTPGISPTAIIDPSAIVHETASIGHYSVVGAGVSIGANSVLGSHVTVGANVKIGQRAFIKSHASIGEQGFAIDKNPNGNNFRIPHFGSVLVGDDVEIGSFSTVASGTIDPTIIGDYVKIDDHVHIAHNCRIEENVIITACAELSGSVKVGRNTWISPNSSIIQGVSIGPNAVVGINTAVIQSVEEFHTVFGVPARKVSSTN